MTAPQDFSSTNTLARIASVPQDLAMGLVYPSSSPDTSAPSDVMLRVGGDGTPLALMIFLRSEEVTQLGALLHDRGEGTVAGIIVTKQLPTTTQQQNVLALLFPRDFRGSFFMMIDYDSADRLASQCTSMLEEYRRHGGQL